jgi:hypothetical protein
MAYRMLGSLAEAEDAVQDAWLRLSHSDAEQIDNLGGWLTTVVARECLHVLRSRRHGREDSFGIRLPDPIITPDGHLDPEQGEQRRQVLVIPGVALGVVGGWFERRWRTIRGRSGRPGLRPTRRKGRGRRGGRLAL